MRHVGAAMLLCAAVAAAQPVQSGSTILHRVAKAYATVSGYQVEAVVTSPAGVADPISIAYRAPGDLRIEHANHTDSTLFHGDTVSVRNPHFSSYQVPPPGAHRTFNDAKHRHDALLAAGYADYTAIDKSLVSANVVRREDVSLEGTAVACAVVEAQYRHGVQRTYWIDLTRHAVLREVDGGAATSTITVRKLIWDSPPPEALLNVPLTSGVPLPDGSVSPGPNGWVPAAVIARRQNPEYTPEARLAHLNGMVLLSFTIDTDGRPTGIRVTNPIGMGLDEKAVQCLSDWRYRPAEKNGTPTAIKASVSLSFDDDGDSDWSLARAIFPTENGVLRPVLVKADYPAPFGFITRRGRIQLHLTIDKNGIPRNVRVVSGLDTAHDREAVGILKAWRFHPGEKDGIPVDVPADFDFAYGGGVTPIFVRH